MRIIAGRWKGRRLVPVRGRRIRPTTDRVREAWMSILLARLEDAAVLDLFSGSGALGLEALSRGAAHVTFVERSRGAIRVLERNLRQLNAEEDATVVHGEALAYVRKLEALQFDVALADPPYEKGFAAELLSAYGRVPFARELWIEHRFDEGIPDGLVAEQRRYGDTSLSCATHEAPEAPE